MANANEISIAVGTMLAAEVAVIVDHIGLSGVLIRKGETTRPIVFSCAKWVPPTNRSIFAVAQGQGGEASGAIGLRVSGAEELVQAGE